jgi:hypothetical protein
MAESQLGERLAALLETVEDLRAQKFSMLDSELVKAILALHADSTADDSELARKTEKLVEEYLAQGK